MLIPRIVVITRQDRAHRLDGFLTRWARCPLGDRPVEIHTAPVTPDGTVGCLASHLDVLRAYQYPTLIMEDDVCFSSDFPYSVAPPPDWDVLWLGGQHVCAPQAATAGWVRPVELLRTHCYIARHPARLEATFVATRPPRIDPYLARLPLAQYCVHPHTAGQVAGPSDTGGADLSHDTWWQLGGHTR